MATAPAAVGQALSAKATFAAPPNSSAPRAQNVALADTAIDQRLSIGW
jgi:hypothetical protein